MGEVAASIRIKAQDDAILGAQVAADQAEYINATAQAIWKWTLTVTDSSGTAQKVTITGTGVSK